MSQKTAILIGGTGQIGRAIAKTLLQNDWQVSLAGRREHVDGMQNLTDLGAHFVKLDRQDDRSFSDAIGSGYDAVIDLVAYDQTHAEQLLNVEKSVGSFVVMSSCSVYQDAVGRTLDEARENGFPQLSGPMTEKQPTVAAGDSTYSTKKVALEQRLQEKATIPVIILRPCAIHGPYSVHPREWWFIKRMMDNRKVIPLAYRGESTFHTTSVENIASLTSKVLEQPASRVLNVADSVALSVYEIGEQIAKQMNYVGEIRRLDIEDEADKDDIGKTPWSVPRPFTLNCDAAEELGWKPLAYADTVGETCEWLKTKKSDAWRDEFPVFAKYSTSPFDYEAEDRFFSKLK